MNTNFAGMAAAFDQDQQRPEHAQEVEDVFKVLGGAANARVQRPRFGDGNSSRFQEPGRQAPQTLD